MAGRTGALSKLITNARNSNENFNVDVGDESVFLSNFKRTSAALLQKAIVRGFGNKKVFLTITPQGLPPDLIGDEETAVERQNVLTEPRSHKNEGARLPPFKPFKTISDEDNIHLLPGETGERARLNLLDTKAVAKKDVEDVKKAYHTQRELYPELYKKQKLPIDTATDAKTEDTKKVGFFKKLFGKKNKEPVPLDQPTAPEAQKPPSPPMPEEIKPFEPPPQAFEPEQMSKKDEHSSSSSSSESSSSDEEMGPWGGGYPMYPYMGGYPPQYPFQYPTQYPGFPGGFSPYFNQPYTDGFGPMQLPPCYNPCMEEIQLSRCERLKRDGGHGSGDAHRHRITKSKKQQGLNFDFLPHDDLATEVTMTIEPDEPEPLQYAVENGIMPIICCYMPSSIAVQPQQGVQEGSPQMFGFPPSNNGYGSIGNTSKFGSTYSKTTKPMLPSQSELNEDEDDGVEEEEEDTDLPDLEDTGDAVQSN